MAEIIVPDPLDERFGGLAPDMVRAMASGFAAGYVDPAPDVPWFDQIRTLAGELGFALRQKDYKKNPDAYPGSIADAAAVIRVLVTGSRQSPDLEQTCAASTPCPERWSGGRGGASGLHLGWFWYFG